MNIVNERYEFSSVIDSLLYDSIDSYASTRLTYLQTVKNQKLSEQSPSLELGLFDPSEEYWELTNEPEIY